MSFHYDTLIVGGGTAGIMTAAQLHQKQPELKIGLFDPAETHYYQPAFTLVAANTYKFEHTSRPMRSVIPHGVHWIQESIVSFQPAQNQVTTGEGNLFTYDYLVVCPGLRMAPELVKGLKDAMDSEHVCSVYTNPLHARRVFEKFKGGTALFTQPTTPIKCGGAPQKIMYLADDLFKKTGVRSKTNMVFATPGTVIFGIKQIADTLMRVVNRKNIFLNFGYKLVEVDSKNQIAWYEMADHEKYHNHNKNVQVISDGNRKGIKYDLLHLAPPQAAPLFVSESPFANENGWMSVDKGTLQSTHYRNVFGLGDVAGLPTAKTGAAIRKQVPVVVANILRLMEADKLTEKKYNGYSSCPLVTGYGKMVLAEFDYENKFTPDPKLKQMLVFDSYKEHWRLWLLKKYILPYLYWHKMLKGKEV